MATETSLPVAPTRQFLPENFSIDSWEGIEPFFQELQNRPIHSTDELRQWLRDRSELEAVLSEEGAWRYIRMTIDTRDEKAGERFTFFVSSIEPQAAPYQDKLNRKLIASPYREALDPQQYFVYLRGVEKELQIFREENVPLHAEIQREAQRYAAITGAQTISYKGGELTMQQAAALLKSTDRQERETVYRLITERRAQDAPALEALFEALLVLRNKVALNAGYTNYRDYMFAALGRFDYTPDDCYHFHESIRSAALPLIARLQEERRKSLGLEVLRPWDGEVDISGAEAPSAFKDGADLTAKSIRALQRIHPYFGECIAIMQRMGYLDLESKEGKAPGGYNYPLYEIGVPFIFMNAVGTARDVVTMVHESGHAVHSFLTRNLELTAFKGLPSEAAELASMSMELISMDAWDEFYPDPDDLRRAKREQLEKIISILPWIATVDQFQHQVYLNPTQDKVARNATWKTVSDSFSTGLTDWSGFEQVQLTAWQRQLHIYEVPFYYIEYGMAQLGALAIWRNYRRNPEQALQQYIDALKLGYTRTIPEIYRAAGIRFDFSPAYVRELLEFVGAELDALR